MRPSGRNGGHGNSPEMIACSGKRQWLGAQVLHGVGQHPAEPFVERLKLALRSVVQAAANECFARVEQQIQDGTPWRAI